MKFERLNIGEFGLVRETEDGRIQQIGLTPAQSEILQAFLAMMADSRPFVGMPEKYDLIEKFRLCEECKTLKSR
jgi:hypothetical protein